MARKAGNWVEAFSGIVDSSLCKFRSPGATIGDGVGWFFFYIEINRENIENRFKSWDNKRTQFYVKVSGE